MSHDPASPRLGPWSVPAGLPAGLLTCVALVPLAVAAVKSVVDDWYPLGDNALYPLRARDVLTSHHPWLGTWSSASLESGVDVNHPGPLFFDLLAVPARLDPIGGVPIGIAVLHAACVIGIAIVAHRIGGLRSLAISLAVTVTFLWSLGTLTLVDPWQPYAMLVPFLLLLVLSWGLSNGDLPLLPMAVAVASLLVQTHLGYTLLAPGVLVAGVALGVGRLRRTTASSRRPWLWVVLAGIVGLLLWAQPLAEQLSNGTDGNLYRLATTRGGDGDRVGPELGLRLVAGVVAQPPWWLPGSLGTVFAGTEAIAPGMTDQAAAVEHVPSARAALSGLGVVAALLGTAAWFRRRAGARSPAPLALVVAFVVVVSAVVQPASPGLGMGTHQVAWLWPFAAFVTLALLEAVVPRGNRILPVLAVLIVAASAGASLRDGVDLGPQVDRTAEPVMRSLGEQLKVLQGGGPYLLDFSDLYFAEPYSGPVMLELQRHGIDFVVADDYLVRQVGTNRRSETAAGGRLYLLIGPAAIDAPAGERVALALGLSPQERADRRAARAEVDELAAAQTPLRLSRAGEVALAAGRLPVLEEGASQVSRRLVDSGELSAMARLGYLDADSPHTEVITTWARLDHRWLTETVGVFVDASGADADDSGR